MKELQVGEKYERGPKNFQNLNLTPERQIVQGSATRYRKPTIF